MWMCSKVELFSNSCCVTHIWLTYVTNLYLPFPPCSFSFPPPRHSSLLHRSHVHASWLTALFANQLIFHLDLIMRRHPTRQHKCLISGASFLIFQSVLALLFPPPLLRWGVSYHPPTPTKRPLFTGVRGREEKEKKIALWEHRQSTLSKSFSFWDMLTVTDIVFLVFSGRRCSQCFWEVVISFDRLSGVTMVLWGKKRDKKCSFSGRVPLLSSQQMGTISQATSVFISSQGSVCQTFRCHF